MILFLYGDISRVYLLMNFSKVYLANLEARRGND